MRYFVTIIILVSFLSCYEENCTLLRHDFYHKIVFFNDSDTFSFYYHLKDQSPYQSVPKDYTDTVNSIINKGYKIGYGVPQFFLYVTCDDCEDYRKINKKTECAHK